MSRKSPRPQSRRHVMMFDEDWEFLSREYGSGSDNRIGAGTVVKLIMHRFVNRLRTQINDARDNRTVAEVAEETIKEPVTKEDLEEVGQ